jgi:hypothetical protein
MCIDERNLRRWWRYEYIKKKTIMKDQFNTYAKLLLNEILINKETVMVLTFGEIQKIYDVKPLQTYIIMRRQRFNSDADILVGLMPKEAIEKMLGDD